MANDVIVCPQCGKQLRLRAPQPPRGRVRCPGCDTRFIIGEGDRPKSIPPAAKAVAPIAPPSDPGEPMFVPLDSEPDQSLESLMEASISDTAPPLRALRKRRNPSRYVIPVVIGAIALLGIAFLFLPKQDVPAEAKNHVGAVKSEKISEATTKQAEKSDSDASAAEKNDRTAAQTKPGPVLPGPVLPVSLRAMPAGVRVVVHLHPSRIWKHDKQRDELAACAAPLSAWGVKAIRTYTGFAPEQLDEATFGLVLKGPGVAPDVSVVARVAETVELEQIALKFPPDSRNAALDAKAAVISGNRAMIRIDDRTFAACPKELAKEMADAVNGLNPTDPAIEELLPQTDRESDFTLICRPDDVQTNADTLFSASARGLAATLSKWFDPANVESVAVSLWVNDEELQARLLLRSKAEITPVELSQDLKKRIESLPTEMISQVERINPQNAGRRRVLGRLPAMLKASSMAAKLSPVAKRLLSWNVALPERAAPNLLLAAHLLWDESRSPSVASATARSSPTKKNDPIVELLKKPIDVNFRRVPLHEAIAFIASEIGGAIELDGSGLQQSGFTRNMPQTLKLEQTAAGSVLAAIFKAYPQMVIVEDGKGGALVTVKAVAEKRHLKPIALIE